MDTVTLTKPVIFETRNTLLRCLTESDLRRLAPSFRLIELRPRQILHHWNMPMEQVYFIEHGLVSVSARIAVDRSVAAWLIGSEGMTGVPVVLGDREHPVHRRVVQVGGLAWQISAADLTQGMEQVEPFRALLLRYISGVLLQTSQGGACNAHHELKQRLARWLLMASDGLGSGELPLTHQVLGRLLGVRRASVSDSLSVLDHEGSIRTMRGLIRIIDRPALERASCECYTVIRREQRRLAAHQLL